MGNNFAAGNSLLAGIDAPTPARIGTGALTLFFRWRKKSVQKKASGTATPEAARPASRSSQISAFRALPCQALVFAQACQSLTAFGSCAHWAHAPSRPKLRPAVAPSGLSSSSVRFAHPPGKRLLCPFWRRGSLCRAQQSWPAYACYRARSELAFFRRQNGRAFFPPLPIAALLPHSWRGASLPLAGGMLRRGLFFLHCKRPAGFQIHAGLFKRAMRPVAEWRSLHDNKQGAAPDRRAARPVAERR